MNAADMMLAVRDLDDRAQQISPKAYAALTCMQDKWSLTVFHIGNPQIREFTGTDPAALIVQAKGVLAGIAAGSR